MPDPQDPQTFHRSKLDWDEISGPQHARMLEFYRALIGLRRSEPDLQDPWLSHLEIDYDERSRWILMHRGRIAIACNLNSEAAGAARHRKTTVGVGRARRRRDRHRAAGTFRRRPAEALGYVDTGTRAIPVPTLDVQARRSIRTRRPSRVSRRPELDPNERLARSLLLRLTYSNRVMSSFGRGPRRENGATRPVPAGSRPGSSASGPGEPASVPAPRRSRETSLLPPEMTQTTVESRLDVGLEQSGDRQRSRGFGDDAPHFDRGRAWPCKRHLRRREPPTPWCRRPTTPCRSTPRPHHGRAVDELIDGIQRDRPTGRQSRDHRRGTRGFDAQHRRVGGALGQIRGDSGNASSAADRGRSPGRAPHRAGPGSRPRWCPAPPSCAGRHRAGPASRRCFATSARAARGGRS